VQEAGGAVLADLLAALEPREETTLPRSGYERGEKRLPVLRPLEIRVKRQLGEKEDDEDDEEG